MIENITRAFADKKFVKDVFFNLSKAFDTIDQSILLFKLHHHRIRELPHDWYTSYLSNRSTQTEANGKLSSPLLVYLVFLKAQY